jgi:hypothetical protein
MLTGTVRSSTRSSASVTEAGEIDLIATSGATSFTCTL